VEEGILGAQRFSKLSVSRSSDSWLRKIETTLGILHVLFKDVSTVRETGIVGTTLLGYDAKGRHRTFLGDRPLGRTILDWHTAWQGLQGTPDLLLDGLLGLAR
jgi:hypothetical protein